MEMLLVQVSFFYIYILKKRHESIDVEPARCRNANCCLDLRKVLTYD